MKQRLALTLFALLALALPSLAQEYTATTTTTDAGAAITEEQLKIRLRPLTKDQCEIEANAWLALLQQKNLEIRDALLADPNANVQALRDQQSQLVSRLDKALQSFVARGGDAEPFQQYVDASTGADLDATNVTGIYDYAKSWLTSPEGGIKLAINVVKFLVTLLVFAILAKIAAGIVRRAMGRMRKTSDLLRDFFVNVTRKLVFFVGLVIALGMLGLDITPFVAALGAAGFIIGFALQGTLSNFAAGLMILMYRPYDIGEVVTVADTTGKVDAMTLVSTTLRLPDNQTVVIPNNAIWGDVITNITGQATRRVDMKFGCGYDDDLQKAQELLMDIVTKHPKVHAEPAPVVKVHELADSSVNFIVRPWANTGDYWEVFWDVTREVKDRFDKEGLNIPFPQRDVHVHQVPAAS